MQGISSKVQHLNGDCFILAGVVGAPDFGKFITHRAAVCLVDRFVYDSSCVFNLTRTLIRNDASANFRYALCIEFEPRLNFEND